jgi:integrase
MALAAQGKIAQYLSMYNTRHTFINACIERGVDTVTIADWCGNSDHIIEKVYRSRNRNIDINKQMPNY